MIKAGERGEKRAVGSFRGLRGGSWNNNENNLRSSNRNNNNPDNENNNNGFRIASPWEGDRAAGHHLAAGIVLARIPRVKALAGPCRIQGLPVRPARPELKNSRRAKNRRPAAVSRSVTRVRFSKGAAGLFLF